MHNQINFKSKSYHIYFLQIIILTPEYQEYHSQQIWPLYLGDFK